LVIFIFEAILITSALSVDAFVVSFAYGSNKIKIPFISIMIITFICSFVLMFSLLLGLIIKDFIPIWLTSYFSFIILFSLGLIKLIDYIIKSIKKNKSIFKSNFILNLYTNPETADFDKSRFISSTEASILALGLSLDGLAIGFGVAIGSANIPIIFIISLIIGFLSIISGFALGNKIAADLRINLSWLSGVILIGLAFFNLLN